tara:strand:+ start:2670 stop:2861 length:192 start_codon:yes stop_codon:yes gene_type:complete
MIKVNKLNPWPCKQKNCFKPAIYEFTNDMEDEKGEYKTITIGHSCENHVEEVNKMLKEIYNGD